MPICGINSYFFRGVSTKGFEHSHLLSDVILRCLVLAALPANGKKDDSVQGVVETSEEMQDQEENIPPPLKDCCLCEKLVQDPEWLEAVGESNEACEDSLSLEQQLGKRGEDSCSTAPGHPMCHPIHFRVSDKGTQTRAWYIPYHQKAQPSVSLQWPQMQVQQDSAMHCRDRTFPMDAAVNVTLLIHCSGSGQKVGSLTTCPWAAPLTHCWLTSVAAATRKSKSNPDWVIHCSNTTLFSTCITQPLCSHNSVLSYFSSQHLAFWLANITFPLPSPSWRIWQNYFFCKSCCKCWTFAS